jgi:glutaconate CoA-transferase subunit B
VPPETAHERVEATGWELRVADDVRETEPPTEAELRALRSLRTKGAG